MHSTSSGNKPSEAYCSPKAPSEKSAPSPSETKPTPLEQSAPSEDVKLASALVKNHCQLAKTAQDEYHRRLSSQPGLAVLYDQYRLINTSAANIAATIRDWYLEHPEG